MLIIENRRSCSFKCYNILISLYFISRLNNSDSFIPCLHIFFPALQLQIPFLPYCLFCSVDFSNVVIARIINAINSKHVSITALIFSIISSLLQYVTSSSSKFIFITIGTNPSPFEHAQTISIHSPHAGGDADIVQLSVISSYFNPLPSCEGRHGLTGAEKAIAADFNPLPSCEGRLRRSADGDAGKSFQSTPLMRGETPRRRRRCRSQAISIHSPHARGDTGSTLVMPSVLISIHSPHARGDRNRA